MLKVPQNPALRSVIFVSVMSKYENKIVRRPGEEKKLTKAVIWGKVYTVFFTRNLAWAYSKQLVTSWPFVSLSQSV